MKKLIRSLPLLLVVIPTLGRADIIMVNFNLSFEELASAQKAAQAKGEKVVVIPDMDQWSPADQSAITKLRDTAENDLDAIHAAEANLSKSGMSADSTTPAGKAIGVLQQKYAAAKQAVYDKVLQLDPAMKNFSGSAQTTEGGLGLDFKDYLAATIKKVGTSGSSFSGLILSGHSGQGDYFGDVGSMMKSEFFSLLSDPSITPYTQSLHQLYLWGCNGLTPQESYSWYSAFPNLQMIAGFNGVAPRETKAGDLTYLQDSITNEDKLVQLGQPGETVTDKEAVQHILGDMQEFRNLDAMNTALLICGYYYHNGRVDTQDSLQKACFLADGKSDSVTVQKTIQDYKNIFQNYMEPIDNSGKPNPAFADVPNNTDSSDLRTYYENLQAISYCQNPSLKSASGDLTNPDLARQVKLLLFFKDILRQFVNTNSADLARLKIDIHSPMPRAQVLEAIAEFGKELKTSGKEPSQDDLAFFNKLENMLVNLNPDDVPTSWID